jgi:hypothetical protein
MVAEPSDRIRLKARWNVLRELDLRNTVVDPSGADRSRLFQTRRRTFGTDA